MKVAFRVDASRQVGSGHLMRCLTLGQALGAGGARVSFICRELPGHLCQLVEERGFGLHRLPAPGPRDGEIRRINAHSDWLGVDWMTDAKQTAQALEADGAGVDWLVVDSYALDVSWQGRLRGQVGKILVIDDLADRSHDCDLLLDQNLVDGLACRYKGLVPPGCRLLLGPPFALLRLEFFEAKGTLAARDGQVRRLLIFMGGSDPDNETAKALEAVRLLGRTDLRVDVVVGSSNPHQRSIEELCQAVENWTYHCQVKDMAALMAAADLAVGAGGGSALERCFLGLPAVTVQLADNQKESAEAVSRAGASLDLGEARSVAVADLHRALQEILGSPETLARMSRAALALMGDTPCVGTQAVAVAMSGGDDA